MYRDTTDTRYSTLHIIISRYKIQLYRRYCPTPSINYVTEMDVLHFKIRIKYYSCLEMILNDYHTLKNKKKIK
jgi:hypothetical protein